MSVPVPTEISPPAMSTGNTFLQDLMTRRREARHNRMRYHLTETDCVLLCTHGVEKYYQHGQVIAEEGEPIRSVYRIKSGRICLQKQGQRLYNLTQGFFIGEGLFIRHEDEYDDYFGATLVANGPVTITELNIPFVRQLLEADKVLAFKIYRHIAGKLSALLLSVLGSVAVEEYIPSPKSDHTSPISVRSDSQGSINSSSSSDSSDRLQKEGSSSNFLLSDLQAPPKSVIMTEEMVKEASTRVSRRKLHRLTGKLKEKTPFKVYNLDKGGHIPVTCQLTSQKIIIVTGTGIKTKRKIKYNKILDISRTGQNAATIVYGVQARTLFFRTEEELNEFCGIVSSLISAENKELFTTQIAPNVTLLSSGLVEPPTSTTPPPEPQISDREVMHSLATRQDLKQGEFVVAQGDLYQRIYIVVSGELHMKKNGKHLVTLRDGEVFGVLTLFHLRPSMMDVEVASETATLLIIPAYRIVELITSNFPLAVRLHKKAAQLIYSQVGQLLKSRDEVVEKFSEANLMPNEMFSPPSVPAK